MKRLLMLLLFNLGVLLLFQNCAQRDSIHLEKVTASSAGPGSGVQDPADPDRDGSVGGGGTNPGGNNPPTNGGGDGGGYLPPLVNYKSCNIDGMEKPHLWSQWGLKNLPPTPPNNHAVCNLFELRQCLDGMINPLSVGDPSKTECIAPPLVNPAGTASCMAGGKTILHGHLVVLFKDPVVNGASNCVGQIRRCINGNLTGSNAYSSYVCGESFYKPASGTAYGCKLNGLEIPDGSAIVSFSEEIATVSDKNPKGHCDFEERRCIQGRLSGSKTKNSCLPKEI